MMIRSVSFAAAALAALSLAADVKLPPLFSNNAVLLRSADTPVFGSAAPGETVTVSLAGVKGETQADNGGKWQIRLDLTKVGAGPFELAVEGKNKLSVKNILVGEVWLCSGQSNMDFRARGVIRGKEEMDASANPLLRCFIVTKKTRPTPLAEGGGQWMIAAPENTGRFTAVGYFFGRELQKVLQVPVGLIDCAWGGTPIEGWTGREGINKFPAQKKNADAMDEKADTYDARLNSYLEEYGVWQKKFQRSESDLPDVKDAEWKKCKLPGRIPGNGGITFLRRTVDIPANLAGKNIVLSTGRFNTGCQILWDGRNVGELTLTTALNNERNRFTIPAAVVTAGKHELSIRLFSALPDASLSGSGGIQIQNGPNLGGEWEYSIPAAFPALSAEAKKAMPAAFGPRPIPSRLPVQLFNGMVNPLVPYGLSGVIWYQGESNAGRPQLYAEATRALVEDWRGRFGRELPFYWCQLANFQGKTTDPAGGGWAALRDAQTKALSIPKTGQAILIDLGEAGDIHPLNKQEVGRRLALVALAKDYGKNIPFSGPVCKGQKIEGKEIRLSFDFLEGGLVAKPLPATYDVELVKKRTAPLVRNSPDSELEGFAVAGADGKWFWANAKIDGDTVVVQSDKVANPTRVRYAWSSNPTCNLYNKAGLPAVPFQTGE